MTTIEQMREATKPHLRMTLKGNAFLIVLMTFFVVLLVELGLTTGSQLLVADSTLVCSMRVILTLTSAMETSTTQ